MVKMPSPPIQTKYHNPYLPRPLQPTPNQLSAQKEKWEERCNKYRNTATFSEDLLGGGIKFCENYGRGDHFFAECYEPLNENLTLSGCPIYGTQEHSFDEFFHSLAFKQQTLNLWLVRKRI